MLSFPVLESAAAAAESLRRATRIMFPIRAPPLTKKLRPFIQEFHKVGNPPLHRVQAAFWGYVPSLETDDLLP